MKGRRTPCPCCKRKLTIREGQVWMRNGSTAKLRIVAPERELKAEVERLREALQRIVDFDPKSRRLAAHIARDALAGSSEANDAGVIAPQSASESNEPYWARPLKADDEGPSQP